MQKETGFSLEDFIKELNKTPSLFRDERYFDINFLPEIYYRDLELSHLSVYFSSLATNQETNSVIMLFSGRSGVGKTATIKRFASDLLKVAKERNVRLRYVHVNCRKEKTIYKILTTVLRTIDKNFPVRGYSIPDLFEIIKSYLRRYDTNMLLVLDELDYIIDKDEDFLYSLTRINDDSIEDSNALSIIGIIKEISSSYKVDSCVRDYFRGKVFEFNPYSRDQLYDILEHKVERGFNEGVVSKDVLEHIVSLIEESGNLRYAMNLLWSAGKIAESKNLSKITLECVNTADRSQYPQVYKDALKDFPKEKLMFLESVITTIKKSNETQISLKESFDKYQELCKKLRITPRSYSQVWSYIQQFEEENILKVSVENGIHRGRRSILRISEVDLSEIGNTVRKLLNSKGVEFN